MFKYSFIIKIILCFTSLIKYKINMKISWRKLKKNIQLDSPFNNKISKPDFNKHFSLTSWFYSNQTTTSERIFKK